MQYTHYSQLSATSAAILDTETTGTSPSAEACEIAMLMLDPLHTYPLRPFFANKVDEYVQRFSVNIDIHPAAEAVHGIRKADLAGCDNTKQFLLPEVDYLICHNTSFDRGILRNCHPSHDERFDMDTPKPICTLNLARKIWNKTEVSNYKLTTLVTELVPGGAALVTEAHGALPDCKLTLIVLSLILQKLPRVTSWQELYDYQSDSKAASKPKDKASSGLMETMPFGKYKGESFDIIPRDYLQWLSKQDLTDKLQRTVTEWIGK